MNGCVAQYDGDNHEIAHLSEGCALNEITFLFGDEKDVKYSV